MGKGEVILICENEGAFSQSKLYIQQDNNELEIVQGEELTSDSAGSIWSILAVKKLLKSIFLPNGFPSAVSPDYIEYQCWDTVQAFASSINGSLALESVMKGLGVGDAASTPAASAMVWLLKVGSGMVGQIVFAWFKGTSLDYDSKKWRLFADILNDFATFIDLIAPLFPSNLVVFIFSLSSISRALVGVAGSATRSSVTAHQARKNNMADVSAKDGSQETLVNLFALICSLIIIPMVAGNAMLAWTLFCFLTTLHIFANYKAVRSLRFETLNIQRLLLCLKVFLSSSGTNLLKNIPSIQQVNQAESVLVGFGIKDQDVCGFKINIGDTLENCLQNRSVIELQSILIKSNGRPFIIIPNEEKRTIFIVLNEQITPFEIIEAYTLGILTANSLKEKEKDRDSLILKQWMEFKRLLSSKGFALDRALINTGEWRAKWKME